MTVEAPARQDSPQERWPDGALYFSPRGLYPFQQEAIAACLTYDSTLVALDTGLGKSHVTMATGATSVAWGECDVVLVVCKQNKVREWVDDFAAFTRLSVRKNFGTAALRRRWFEKNPVPQVIVTTYDTGRIDLTSKVLSDTGKSKVIRDGWLLEHLVGKRVIVAHDEASKIAFTNQNAKAWTYVLKRLRSTGSVRLLQLTATLGNVGNSFRLLQMAYPDRAPLVKDFDAVYVQSVDQHGNPRYNKSLTSHFRERHLDGGYLIRKRKTDPDVRDQFPPVTEDATAVELGDDHAEFYDIVRSLGLDPETGEPLEEPPPGLWTVLRQVAGHPQALLHGRSALARLLVEEFGVAHIRGLSSAKTDRLVSRMVDVTDQGAKAVVFTHWAGSVLPVLAGALRAADVEVFEYHGGVGGPTAQRNMDAFKVSATPCVFLCGDGASDGVNLPMATYVEQYEPTPSHDLYTQRINRCVRIGHNVGPVTANTLRALGTVDEGALEAMLSANQVGDDLRGDSASAEESWVTPSMRRAMLTRTPITRKRKT